MINKLRTAATSERWRTAVLPDARRRAVHALLLCTSLNSAFAQISEPTTGPLLPCAGASERTIPPSGELNGQPRVGVWRDIELSAADSCSSDVTGHFELAIALAGRFESSESLHDLAKRIGTVSAIRRLSYWSVTDGKWRPLSTNAFAVRNLTDPVKRDDFSAGEVLSGDTLIFSRDDSRSTGQTLYAVKAIAVSEDSLVLETRNVTAVQMLLFTLFKANELRSIHYLRRDAGNRWSYYGLSAARTLGPLSDQRSFINRAAAYFRHLAGQPADGAPPLAP